MAIGARIVCAGITTATIAVLGVADPALAAAALTLSSASGPSGGGNTLVATAASAVFGVGVTPTVTFQTTGASGTATCSSTLTDPVAITVNPSPPFAQTAGTVVAPALNVIKLSATKLVIKVPSNASSDATNTDGLVLGDNQTIARYNACVYNGSTVGTSTLVASGAYSIAAPPTVTGVTPSHGPSLGGTTIAVSGTNFTTGMTASIGGIALSGIQVNADGTQFTAVTPAHTPSTSPETITAGTVGGSVTSAALYTFTNGIVVTPSTAEGVADGGTTQILDIAGTGFLGVGFPSTPAAASDATTAEGHVFLVRGRYDQTDDGNGGWTSPPVAECGDVLVIDDEELICTLDLTSSIPAGSTATAAATDIPDGAYTVTIVNTGVIGPAAPDYQTRVTNAATFTIAAY
jgi:hypothetical protein